MRLRGNNMRSILSILIIPLLALIISCTGTPAATTSAPPATTSFAEENTHFVKSSNHFVRNSYEGETNPSYLLIQSYPSFNSVYGVGAVMGMDASKLITEDKMKDAFVLSIIYQGNNITAFDIEKITLKGSQLEVYYTSKVVNPNATWTCNCHVTVLIDNCKFDSILLYENGKPLPDAVIKDMQ